VIISTSVVRQVTGGDHYNGVVSIAIVAYNEQLERICYKFMTVLPIVNVNVNAIIRFLVYGEIS